MLKLIVPCLTCVVAIVSCHAAMLPAKNLDQAASSQYIGGMCFAMNSQACEDGETAGCAKKQCEWFQPLAGPGYYRCPVAGETILLRRPGYLSATPANPGQSGRQNYVADEAYYCQSSEQCGSPVGCPDGELLICTTVWIPILEDYMVICLPWSGPVCNAQITVLNGGDPRSVNVLDAAAPECSVPGLPPQTAPPESVP